MRRSIVLVFIFAALVGVGLPVHAADHSACLVTDEGKINDATFNQFTYEGMMRAAKDFNLKSNYIETQALTDDEANINTCVQQGYDIIITVGYRIADLTYAAAAANPDRYFIGVDAQFAKPLPNLVGIQAREDQAGFVVGSMAALMTKSKVVAGVYGVEEPPVMRFRNGFEQGVRYIDPTVKILGLYIDDYTAPDRGAAAAEQFVGEGADVIFGAGGETGDGGILRAAQMGVQVIGVDQDEYNSTFGKGSTPGANYLISSAMKRVDNGTYQMIQAIVNGQPLPRDSTFVLTVQNDGIDFAPPHDATVPDSVSARVKSIMAGLKDGSIQTGVDPDSGNLLSAMPTEEPTAEATSQS